LDHATHDTPQRFPGWDRNLRAPVPRPPEGACDCQFHIYGDPTRYPPKQNALYEPPDATFADAMRLLDAMGFARGVIVHAMPYDTDHRLLIDTLEALSSAGRARVRAVGIIKDNVSDAELDKLNALGVRAARFNIGKYYKEQPTPEAVRRSLARAKEIGWHARLHVAGPHLMEHVELLDSVPGLTKVVDHMGHLDFAAGVADPACQGLLDRLRDGWWLMLSNGNRLSPQEDCWDDAVPFGRAFVEAAEDRLIWGSDWPHVRWRKRRMINDAESVELLYRYADNDAAILKKILVDNPARLHGFV
jgi:predicted TIM-barrel fold metal-dependent hydrolase